MARFALSVIACITVASTVVAQDAIPETPPELRDFRLDPQRPTAQPQPEAQPVTPPPAVPTVTEPQTAPPRTERQPARRAAEAPPPAALSVPASVPETGATANPVLSAPEAVDEGLTNSALPENEALPAPEPAAASMAMWQIGAALAVLVMALLAVLWFRRRRTSATDEPQERGVAPAQANSARTAESVAPVLSAASVKPSTQAGITLAFMPEKATISFTTLTVKGQLRLINEGSKPARDMQLRAGLISASAAQGAFIEAFHAADTDDKAEPLGDANPGERIAMAIELAVPLTDMESFSVGGQKLLVPIMVASLTYANESDGHRQTARIACMIGREANPPAPKMGPLRLDLGPRSFTPLGQRPVHA